MAVLRDSLNSSTVTEEQLKLEGNRDGSELAVFAVEQDSLKVVEKKRLDSPKVQICFTVSVAQLSSDGYFDVSPLLYNDLYLPKGSGLRISLTPKGLKYIAQKLVEITADEVTKSVDNTSRYIPVPNAYLAFERATVTSYEPPLSINVTDQNLQSVLIQYNDFAATVTGTLRGYYSNQYYKDMTTIRYKFAQMNLWLKVARRNTGSVTLSVENCQIYGRVQPTIQFETQPVERTSIFQSYLLQEGFHLLESLLCERTKRVVSERIDSQLGQMPVKISLYDIIHNDAITGLLRSRRRSNTTPNPSLATFAKQFDMSRMSNLFLDYSITEDPHIRNGAIELGCSGEVSVNGSGQTPFGPVDVPLPPLTDSTAMLNLILTDFVPNSLLYHGHRTGLFKARVDPSTPQVGPMMKTTCDGTSGPLFCLGDVLPTLRHYHPNRGIAMVFFSKTPPVMIFRDEEKGSYFGINCHLTIWAIDENELEKPAGEMDIDIGATIKVKVSHSIIRFKISLEKLEFNSLTTDVLRQDELNDASFICREVMQRMINDLLKDGVPVPIHPLFKLKNLKVFAQDRAYLITTNFELNGKLAKQLISSRRRKAALRYLRQTTRTPARQQQ